MLELFHSFIFDLKILKSFESNGRGFSYCHFQFLLPFLLPVAVETKNSCAATKQQRQFKNSSTTSENRNYSRIGFQIWIWWRTLLGKQTFQFLDSGSWYPKTEQKVYIWGIRLLRNYRKDDLWRPLVLARGIYPQSRILFPNQN